MLLQELATLWSTYIHILGYPHTDTRSQIKCFVLYTPNSWSGTLVLQESDKFQYSLMEKTAFESALAYTTEIHVHWEWHDLGYYLTSQVQIHHQDKPMLYTMTETLLWRFNYFQGANISRLARWRKIMEQGSWHSATLLWVWPLQKKFKSLM